jgi:hypothetical protein
LLDVERVTYDWLGEDRGRPQYRADIHVDVSLLASFTDEVCEKVAAALDTAHLSKNESVPYARAIPLPVTGEWRTHYRSALRSPRNQATLVQLPEVHPRCDGMAFRDVAELRVYEGLKRAQEGDSSTDTITIVPNPAVRVPGRTREPDFLVAYRGRVGLIEVDGASHRHKYAGDKSRDQLFEVAGIAWVRRIDAQDTEAVEEVDAFIASFLRKLAER